MPKNNLGCLIIKAMSYSNVYQACDYVTVFLTGRNTDNPGATTDRVNYHYDIPLKYMSNDRGSMVTVQIVSGFISLNANHLGVQIHLGQESPNGFTVNDNIAYEASTPPPAQVPTTPVIGVSGENNQNCAGEVIPTGEYLIPARPQKLHLFLSYLTGGTNSTSFVTEPPTNIAGAVTLKFTYYDAVSSTVNIIDHQNYKTL